MLNAAVPRCKDAQATHSRLAPNGPNRRRIRTCFLRRRTKDNLSGGRGVVGRPMSRPWGRAIGGLCLSPELWPGGLRAQRHVVRAKRLPCRGDRILGIGSTAGRVGTRGSFLCLTPLSQRNLPNLDPQRDALCRGGSRNCQECLRRTCMGSSSLWDLGGKQKVENLQCPLRIGYSPSPALKSRHPDPALDIAVLRPSHRRLLCCRTTS
jgi:hypothetical protein